jgi:hypothetical protein
MEAEASPHGEEAPVPCSWCGRLDPPGGRIAFNGIGDSTTERRDDRWISVADNVGGVDYDGGLCGHCEDLYYLAWRGIWSRKSHIEDIERRVHESSEDPDARARARKYVDRLWSELAEDRARLDAFREAASLPALAGPRYSRLRLEQKPEDLLVLHGYLTPEQRDQIVAFLNGLMDVPAAERDEFLERAFAKYVEPDMREGAKQQFLREGLDAALWIRDDLLQVLLADYGITREHVADVRVVRWDDVDLDAFPVEAQAVGLLPIDVATRCGIVPIAQTADEVTVAIANPFDDDALTEVQRILGARLRLLHADPVSVRRLLDDRA